MGTKIPVNSASMGFVGFLKREIDVVKAKHIAGIAKTLEPLVFYLKASGGSQD